MIFPHQLAQQQQEDAFSESSDDAVELGGPGSGPKKGYKGIKDTDKLTTLRYDKSWPGGGSKVCTTCSGKILPGEKMVQHRIYGNYKIHKGTVYRDPRGDAAANKLHPIGQSHATHYEDK